MRPPETDNPSANVNRPCWGKTERFRARREGPGREGVDDRVDVGRESVARTAAPAPTLVDA